MCVIFFANALGHQWYVILSRLTAEILLVFGLTRGQFDPHRKICGPHAISQKNQLLNVSHCHTMGIWALFIPANTIAACKKRRSGTENFSARPAPLLETSVHAGAECGGMSVPPHFSASGEFYPRARGAICVVCTLFCGRIYTSGPNVIHSRWLLLYDMIRSARNSCIVNAAAASHLSTREEGDGRLWIRMQRYSINMHACRLHPCLTECESMLEIIVAHFSCFLWIINPCVACRPVVKID